MTTTYLDREVVPGLTFRQAKEKFGRLPTHAHAMMPWDQDWSALLRYMKRGQVSQAVKSENQYAAISTLEGI